MGARATMLCDTSGVTNLRAQWNKLAEVAKVTVYQRHEWVATWLTYFSSPDEPRIITAWDNGELVRIAPFVIQKPLGQLPFGRTLRLAGSYRSSYLDFIAKPGYEEEFASLAANQLMVNKTWEQLWLANIPQASLSVAAFLRRMSEIGCRETDRTASPTLTIDFPASWDVYFNRLSKQTRYKLRTNGRKLADAGFQTRVVNDIGHFESAWNLFAKLDAQRRQEKGWRSTKEIEQFRKHAVQSLMSIGRATIVLLQNNDRCIAADISLLDPFARSAWGYRSGLDTRIWGKHSPGIVLRFAVFKDMIERGIRVYDEGGGTEAYKNSFKPRTEWSYACRLVPPWVSAQAWNYMLEGGRQALQFAQSIKRLFA